MGIQIKAREKGKFPFNFLLSVYRNYMKLKKNNATNLMLIAGSRRQDKRYDDSHKSLLLVDREGEGACDRSILSNIGMVNLHSGSKCNTTNDQRKFCPAKQVNQLVVHLTHTRVITNVTKAYL